MRIEFMPVEGMVYLWAGDTLLYQMTLLDYQTHFGFRAASELVRSH